MSDQPGLFPELGRVSAPASRTTVNAHRAQTVVRVSWTPIKLKVPRPCQECARLQHETAGEFGPRADARHRRTALLAGGGKLALDLCSRHADTWRQRDAEAGLGS